MSLFTEWVKNTPAVTPERAERLERLRARERVSGIIRFKMDSESKAVQWRYNVNGDGVPCTLLVESGWVDISDLGAPIPIRLALERLIRVFPPTMPSVRKDLKLGYGL